MTFAHAVAVQTALNAAQALPWDEQHGVNIVEHTTLQASTGEWQVVKYGNLWLVRNERTREMHLDPEEFGKGAQMPWHGLPVREVLAKCERDLERMTIQHVLADISCVKDDGQQ